MNKTLLTLALALCSICSPSVAEAAKPTMEIKSSYVEMMKPTNKTLNVVKDYKMKSSETLDQSEKMQMAIDDLAAKGGGNLVIPKGVYCFSRVYMKSNVHLLVDDGTIFRPTGGNEDKQVMLFFSTPGVKGKKGSDAPSVKETDFIENCSIRCSKKGGRYIVDYSHLVPTKGSGIRFIIASMVRNFYIADATIKDNYSVYCSIAFTPTGSKDVAGAKKWKISRPTNGEIRNCSIYKASPGYGLLQCHGANDLYFENLYSEGGVTLRLETGANTPQIGVYNIKARNLTCEKGKCTLMMGPHISQNGTVLVDGVVSNSCNFAVQIGAGFQVTEHKGNVVEKPGTFANDSRIINVHAIFGTETQLKLSTAWYLEPELFKYISSTEYLNQTEKWSTGPSCGAVIDKSGDGYTVTCENVTTEGFEFNANKVLTAADFAEREKNRKKILNELKTLISE